jgi:hypothetical protein
MCVASRRMPRDDHIRQDAGTLALADGGAFPTLETLFRFGFPMTVRPNHLGIALQRHRRAGRLENRDQRWYLPSSVQREH